MNTKRMEKELIEHCAPTLAGIKCASLFNYFHEGEEIVLEELEEINALLNEKGAHVEVLLWREKSALIYMYRTSMLEKVLGQPEVLELLLEYGYSSNELNDCLFYLKKRLSENPCFPHEIGIFLGYPLEDVKGFIENGGKNCETCGMWKVYCNKDEKDKIFRKLQKCKEVYVQLLCEGRGISQMTVCT